MPLGVRLVFTFSLVLLLSACSDDAGTSGPADGGSDAADATDQGDLADPAVDADADASPCTPGLPECDGNTLVACVDGETVETVCPAGCFQGDVIAICACSDHGDCGATEYCGANGFCEPNPCDGDATVCDENVYVVCGEPSASDVPPTDVVNCGAGTCTAAGCACTRDSACLDVEFCDDDSGLCTPDLCEAGAQSCADGVVTHCDERGARELESACPSAACANDTVCACTNDDVCFPGELCESNACLCASGVSCGERAVCCGEDLVCVSIESCVGEDCETDDRCLPPCDGGVRCGAQGELCCEGTAPICHASNRCVPDCASGIVCGDDLDVCCDTGDVCLFDECRTPGLECEDFRDCDFGEYCEPLLGRCLPSDFPDGTDCREPYDFDEFAPVVDWEWSGVTVNDTLYVNVLGIPVVADMDGNDVPDVVVQAYFPDDVGDGIIVVLAGDTGESFYTNPTEVLHGAGQVAIANIDDDPYPEIATTLALGLGLIDDIVTCPDPAADELGCYLWTATAGTLDRRLDGAAPLFADFDGDGQTELALGSVVLDPRTGEVLVDGGTDSTAAGAVGGQYIAVAADVDGDGVVELLTGGCAFDVDLENGELDELWCNPEFAQGFPGVADVVESPAGPGEPEVVVVVDGEVFILRGDTGLGSTDEPFEDANYLYRFTLPGGGHGGPPNIADFDGDGRVEIGTAGTGCYAVFDVDCTGTTSGQAEGCARPTFPACEQGTDCLIDPCPTDGGAGRGVLWAVATIDDSSETTGSSVFDFQGDGVNEVLYNDECRFLALDGGTGQPFLIVPNSSRTNSEYPIVVDADGDRQSEIVLGSNNDQFARDCEDLVVDRPDYFPGCYPENPDDRLPYCDGGTRGVRTFGDPNGRWVRTRAIWNQHAYSITNIGEDATVPAHPAPSWVQFNTFRANRQGEVPLNAPDPAVASFDYSIRGCPPDLEFSVTVANNGTLGLAAGLPVSLYRTDLEPPVRVATRNTTTAILPGGSVVVGFTYTVPLADLDAEMSFRVAVNDDGSGEGPAFDCDPSSNEAVLDEVVCRVSGPKD